MAWRKWFVRSFVLTVVALCAAAGYAYQQWTNPAAVREQVLAKLKSMYPGADIAVDSARLRLLGGISVNEIRLTRIGDADRIDAVQVPSAIVYHDKEKLLEGELSLRKVELFRPRFRVYKNKDGKWNLQGIAKEQRLDRAMPTLVVHQGTLLLEDRTIAGNISSLEITDLNVTVINDPLPTQTFEGVAQSPLVGKISIAGTIQRATGEIALTFKAKDVPLNAKLLQRIVPFCPQISLQGVELAGQAEFDVKVHSQPGKIPSLHYEVACAVRKTSVKHPLLPMPVEDLEADVRVADGDVDVQRVQARANGTVVKGRGVSQLPCVDQNFEGHVEVDGLRISDDVIARLPEKTRELVRQFQPSGVVNVRAALAKREGQWASLADGNESTITILPDKVAAVFVKFPYPVTDLTGTIDCRVGSKKTFTHLTGKADGQTFVVHGYGSGHGIDADIAAELQAANITIDEKLLKSLPPAQEKFAREFHATGRVDVHAKIRHRPGVVPFENSFKIDFHDGAVEWAAFPLPLTQVKGRLDLLPGGAWEFRDFYGEHDGGVFQISGHSYVVKGREKPGVSVQVNGSKIPLTAALHRALDPLPGLKKVWASFEPSGRMDIVAHVLRPTDALEDLDVRVQGQGAVVQPKFFKYRLSDVAGEFHFTKDRLKITDLSARHGTTKFVAAKGNVDLKPGSGYYADIPDLDVQDLRLDADFLKALPDSLRSSGEMLQLRDPLRVKTKLVVAQSADVEAKPDIYWDARGWLKDASFTAGVTIEGVTGVIACRGRHNGAKIVGVQGNVLLETASAFKQPFTDVQANFRVEENAPETLLAGLKAPLFGGAIAGELRVDFSKVAKYELNLTAAQIDLKKFGQHNLGAKSQLEGKLVGRLYLTGTSEGMKSLDGHGSLNVIDGKLYNLPLILDLLKFLGLRWPDRTAFEAVEAIFRIRGSQVNLRKVDLQGNAVSLVGQGEFNLDGTDLHVDFYPIWARIEQVLPPALRDVPPAVSKNFLIIEMRGKVTSNADDLKFHKRAMPILTDPLTHLRELLNQTGDRRTEPALPRLPTLGPDR